MTLPDPMHIISGSLGAHLVPVTQGKRLSSVLANAEREAWENDRREEKKEEDSASRAVRDDQRDRASSRNLVKNARRSKAAQANAIARELDNKAAAAAKPAAKGRRSFYASASEESKEEEEEKKHEPVLARPRVVSASRARVWRMMTRSRRHANLSFSLFVLAAHQQRVSRQVENSRGHGCGHRVEVLSTTCRPSRRRTSYQAATHGVVRDASSSMGQLLKVLWQIPVCSRFRRFHVDLYVQPARPYQNVPGFVGGAGAHGQARCAGEDGRCKF